MTCEFCNQYTDVCMMCGEKIEVDTTPTYVIDTMLLKELANDITNITFDPVILHILKNRWEIVVTDPAHVMLGSFEIYKEEFETYTPAEEEHCISFKSILTDIRDFSFGGVPKNLTIKFSKDNIVITDGKIDRKKSKLSSDSIPKPNVPPNVKMEHSTIKSNDIKNAVYSFASQSDVFSIVTNDKTIVFETKDESGDVSRLVTKTKFPTELDCKFSMSYMEILMKLISSKNVDLYLATEYPLKIVQNGKIEKLLMLAPRIE